MDVHALPPPVVVKEEGEEEEAVYQVTLEEATREAIEESKHKEMAKWPGLAFALAESRAKVQANTLPPPSLPLVPLHSWWWTSTLPIYVSCTPVCLGATDEEY